MKQRQREQFGGRRERRMRREKRRTAHRRHTLGKKFDHAACIPVRMFVAECNRHIGLIVRWIEYALRRNDLDIDIGHERLELRKPRHEPIGCEAEVGG